MENGSFLSYTEQGCKYECRLHHAAKKSGCVPWDYPVPKDLQHLPACLSVPSAAGGSANPLRTFERAMSSNKSAVNCKHCLPNCEEMVFKQQVRTRT